MRGLPLIYLLILVLAGCTGTTSPDYRTISYRPLEFSVPEIGRLSLPRETLLYVREDHELPLVQVSILFGEGELYETAGEEGLASLTAAALRGGGTGVLSPEEYDGAVEQIAALISAGAGPYTLSLSASFESRQLEEGLDLLFALLSNPGFDSSRLEVSRQQMIEGVRRRNDIPSSVAYRTLFSGIYPEHRLGRDSSLESLAAISRDDVVAWFNRSLAMGGLRIAVSGDVDPAALQTLLAGRITGLPPLEKDRQRHLQEVFPPGTARNVAVERELPQTTFVFGMVGITKDDPDLYPLQVLNYVLGGGSFNSRLMREIRSNRGLAYSVYSYFNVGRRLPGPFILAGETKNRSVREVTTLAVGIIEDIRTNGVTPEELALAKESMVNSFVFAFDSAHEVVSRVMEHEMYGYPVDYLQRYRERISGVTLDDIRRVAVERLDPARLSLVLVGGLAEMGDIDGILGRGMDVQAKESGGGE